MPSLGHSAANATRALHMAVVVFVLIGCLSPWKSLLWVHAILVVATVIQWQLNHGTCILTNLENYFRGSQPKEKSGEQGQFIKELLSKFCNPLPSDSTIKNGLYALMGFVVLVSCLRIYYWS